MRKIDRDGLILCKLQGNVFSSSITRLKSSSEIFIRRFMNSSIAKEFDSLAILNDSTNESDIFESIEEEFGKTDYGKTKYNSEALYWIGYLYRYMAYTYELTSKQIYKIIKPKELNILYLPYHSLDCAQAIERILEEKNISYDLEQQNKKLLEMLKRQRYEKNIDVKEIKNDSKKIKFEILYKNTLIGSIILIKYDGKYDKLDISLTSKKFKNNIMESISIQKTIEYSKDKNGKKDFILELPKEYENNDIIEDTGFVYLKENKDSIYYSKSI